MTQQRILLYGVGGGYDILAGYFVYKELKRQGHQVFFANYSFTDDLHTIVDKYIVPITKHTPKTKKNKDYFPEHNLATFLDTTVYAVRMIPPPYLGTALLDLCYDLKIEKVIGIDAGYDALLLGQEKKLSSPFEDMCSVISLVFLNQFIPCELCCVSVTTEGMPMAQFRANCEAMKEAGGLINIWIPNEEKKIRDEDIHEYKKLLDSTPLLTRSIPNECLLAALEGFRDETHFWNYRLRPRMLNDECNDSDYPPVTDETMNHYIFDINVLYKISPFIMELYRKVYQRPPTTQSNMKIHVLAKVSFHEHKQSRNKRDDTKITFWYPLTESNIHELPEWMAEYYVSLHLDDMTKICQWVNEKHNYQHYVDMYVCHDVDEVYLNVNSYLMNNDNVNHSSNNRVNPDDTAVHEQSKLFHSYIHEYYK